MLNLKTVSSLLLRAKTLRAFKEMVTNDYHLLVQLPYPTHYYFKTTLSPKNSATLNDLAARRVTFNISAIHQRPPAGQTALAPRVK